MFGILPNFFINSTKKLEANHVFSPNRLLVAKIHFKTGSLLNCLMCRHSTGLYICAFLGISGPLPVQLLF